MQVENFFYRKKERGREREGVEKEGRRKCIPALAGGIRGEDDVFGTRRRGGFVGCLVR